MHNRRDPSDLSVAGIFAFFILVLVCLLLLVSLWTERSVEYWGTYIKGEPVDIPYWLSVILTVVFNAVILMFNLISELARYIFS